MTDISPHDKARLVDIFCQEIDSARDTVTTEASWARLEQYFYEALCGRHTLTAGVVLAWADAGHPAADRAVRRYGAEILDTCREGELLAQMRGHIVKILLRPLIPFPRGRHVVANLMRDIWLPALMKRASEGTGVPVTRSASTPAPSVNYFLAKACRKKGLKLSERELNRVWGRRNKLAALVEASMPPIPLWPSKRR